MAALAFLEESFDLRVAPGLSSRPTVPGRTKRYTATGVLTQNYTAAFPIRKMDAAPVIRTLAQFEAAQALWFVVHFAGPYMGFRARDWRDYKLSLTNSSLTLISGTTYQVNRVHAYGSHSFIQPIYKPDAGVAVWRTRSGVLSLVSTTVDTTTGHATISDHVGGDTYAAVGTFSLPVTFSDDEWDAEFNPSAEGPLAVSGAIALEEIRL